MNGLDYWPSLQADIRRRIAASDLEHFLEWSSLVGVMFVGPGPIVDAEFDEMLTAGVARPTGVEFGGRPNTNLIHQAYHLYQWQRVTGQYIRDLDSIVEIGGGYGAMARMCRRLGFTGSYRIYDLPEMLDLQRHYFHETNTRGISAYNTLTTDKCDLLIALFSLSEMSLDIQAPYLERIECNHFLIGIHNAPWFGVNVNAPLDARFGSGQRVEHPHLSGRYYLIG